MFDSCLRCFPKRGNRPPDQKESPYPCRARISSAKRDIFTSSFGLVVCQPGFKAGESLPKITVRHSLKPLPSPPPWACRLSLAWPMMAPVLPGKQRHFLSFMARESLSFLSLSPAELRDTKIVCSTTEGFLPPLTIVQRNNRD